MSGEPATNATIILTMTAAAAFCRLSGYAFMRFIPLTPRIEAALAAIPLAVMVGIIGPPVLRGSLPEWAGLFVTVAAARLRSNDFTALILGMAVVAALRAVQ